VPRKGKAGKREKGGFQSRSKEQPKRINNKKEGGKKKRRGPA